MVLFALFSAMQLAQIVCFPKEALQILHDPTQSLFIGAIPMGFATIVNGIVFFCVPRYGSAAVEAALVTFWIDTGLSLISGWLVRALPLLCCRVFHGETAACFPLQAISRPCKLLL